MQQLLHLKIIKNMRVSVMFIISLLHSRQACSHARHFSPHCLTCTPSHTASMFTFPPLTNAVRRTRLLKAPERPCAMLMLFKRVKDVKWGVSGLNESARDVHNTPLTLPTLTEGRLIMVCI